MVMALGGFGIWDWIGMQAAMSDQRTAIHRDPLPALSPIAQTRKSPHKAGSSYNTTDYFKA